MKIFNVRKGLFVIMSLGIVACTHSAEDTDSKSLEPVKVNEYTGELREYEGEELSSISEFVENSISGEQQILETTYRLKISGLVESPLEMTYNEVLNHDHFNKVIMLECVDGWKVKILWEGVLVEDLIKMAGIQGKAATVIFHAADGYRTIIPLEYVLSKHLLLAYNMNGLKLPPKRGFPFQLIAESRKGYTWIKWVTEIELSGANANLNF